MATLSVKNLKGYIAAELNVIITGVHGVGKTAKLKEACDQLGYSVKYYSTATLDSFTELTGIPVPNIPEKTVEYYRPKDIENAEVIFFDEINRGDDRTLNTILEIILEHSINGVELPRLKAVVAAMNPVTEGYTTDELDKALMDRFDVYLQADPEIELGYFVNKFGDRLGKAAASFWTEYHENFTKSQKNSSSANRTPYLSPRRMDKITSAFRAIPSRQTISDTLPPEVLDRSLVTQLFRVLNEAMAPEATPETGLKEQVTAILMQPISVQRSAATGLAVSTLLKNPALSSDDKNRLLISLGVALNSSKGVATIIRDFGDAVQAMSNTQISNLTNGWPVTKINDLKNQLAAL